MARTTNSVKHTHQYFRRDDGLWACSGIDDCSHYMPKNMSPLPAGKKSICWNPHCKHPEFQLLPYHMQDSKPMCDDCTERMAMIEAATEEMMKSAPKPKSKYEQLVEEIKARQNKVEPDAPTSEEPSE